MDSKANLDSPQTPFLKAGARILQIGFLHHLIVGQAIAGRPQYFSFQETGMI
jgi:hypothetical protein